MGLIFRKNNFQFRFFTMLAEIGRNGGNWWEPKVAIPNKRPIIFDLLFIIIGSEIIGEYAYFNYGDIIEVISILVEIGHLFKVSVHEKLNK